MLPVGPPVTFPAITVFPLVEFNVITALAPAVALILPVMYKVPEEVLLSSIIVKPYPALPKDINGVVIYRSQFPV